MAFHKHAFHYDEREHEQELERLRHQQNIQKEWLDQQIAEKARMNQEGRRDGRIDHNEYEQFEERRIARFKFNLIRRIIENWSSVTSFDWAEANQLAQGDPKFKDALDAAKENHERREKSKLQRQEELQRKQMESLEKEKGPARHKVGNLEFDPNDPYSKLLNGMHPVQLQEPPAPSIPSPTEPELEPARPTVVKSVPVPPIKTPKTRQSMQPSPQPVYYQQQPLQPPPVQIIAPPQAHMPPSELKILLEFLQEQRSNVLHNSTDLHIETMSTNFQKKLDEIVASTEKNIKAAVSESVRKELEGKLSELRLLVNAIEQQRLESRQKDRRAAAPEQMKSNADAETSMSPRRVSPEPRNSLPPDFPSPISPVKLGGSSGGDSPPVYSRLSINDPVDYIVKSLQERNANRMATMLTKNSRHGSSGTPDANIEEHNPARMTESLQKNQSDVYANLLTMLDQLNGAEADPSGSQLHSQSALLSATEFMARVLHDLDQERGDPDQKPQA